MSLTTEFKPLALDQLRREAGEDVRWASRRSVDIDSSRATAMKIDITDTLSFDLNKSLKTNVRALLDSGLISDEAMITLYLALTGGGT